MLWAATSACATALPQCSSESIWYSKRGCGKRATSPATKTSSVTMPYMLKARQPASQANPRGPAASPDSASHSVLRIAPKAITMSASIRVPSESSAPVSLPSRLFNAVTVTPQRRSTPRARWSLAAKAPKAAPRAPTSGAGPCSVTVTSTPRSRQAEAISEPVNPAPITSTRLGPASSRFASSAASSLVRRVNTPSSAASSAFGQGLARVPVAISSRSKGSCSPSASTTSLPIGSTLVARMPSFHLASTSRRRGRSVSSARTRPSSTCLDNGGRSYGSWRSSPTMVSSPAKPSSRSVSAARRPASEAPTTTIRPFLRSLDTGARRLLDQDGLDWAGRGGPADALALELGGPRRVRQGLLAMDLEHLRGEERTLRIALAAVEVDDDLHPGHSSQHNNPSSASVLSPPDRPLTTFSIAATVLVQCCVISPLSCKSTGARPHGFLIGMLVGIASQNCSYGGLSGSAAAS